LAGNAIALKQPMRLFSVRDRVSGPVSVSVDAPSLTTRGVIWKPPKGKPVTAKPPKSKNQVYHRQAASLSSRYRLVIKEGAERATLASVPESILILSQSHFPLLWRPRRF
jgi:hypothetical protein